VNENNPIRRNIRKFIEGYSLEDRTGPLDWHDIGYLIDGLAFAQTPLRQATGKVTQKYNLGPRGAFILRLLANGLLYPLDLATALCCGRSLITAELARLTDAGLVTARPGENDRRRSELRLTPLGQAETEKLREEIRRIVSANLAGFTPDEVRKFAVMLHAARGEPPRTQQVEFGEVEA
jgi:DNA-binding MarR family transcriptional regulator